MVSDTETCSASPLFFPDHTRALARGLGLALARALALARRASRSAVPWLFLMSVDVLQSHKNTENFLRASVGRRGYISTPGGDASAAAPSPAPSP